MAEKKQGKDYKAGSGKKWLVGFGVIALIAIVIVIIIVSIPPNPNSAMQLLNKASTNSFMMSATEKTSFDTFETKVANSQKVNNYLKVMPKEMADVETLSISLAGVLEHYNDYIIFAIENNALNNNYKDIKNGLNKAMESQKELNSIMIEVNKLSEQSPTYLQNAWIEFRQEYVEWLGHYQNAIDALKVAYQDGLGGVTANNLASTIILNTVSDYIQVLYNGFNALATADAENPNASTYVYNMQGKVQGFEDFVDYYLTNDTEIKDYYFNTLTKEKYKKINKYFELYAETDMKNAISSIELISGKVVVTKSYSGVVDTDGVYTAVRLFLMGGV